MKMLDALRRAAPDHTTPPDKIADWRTLAERDYSPAEFKARRAVGYTNELERVLSLARRPPIDLDGPRGKALVELMTERLKRNRTDSCNCKSMFGRSCITTLLPTQAWALYEAGIAGGLVGAIGVGHGKTGLDILVSLVVPDVKMAVLLVPPALRNQLVNDYLLWREHFRVPSLVVDGKGWIVAGAPVVHVLPYSKLSRPEYTTSLKNLAPDLIISDEAHKLRHRDTSGTGRFLRYFAEDNPNCRFVCWSGTLTDKSIKDYAHLSALALRGGSPLPIDPNTVEEWALALDPNDWPSPAGELVKLKTEPDETLHRAFHRRLVETRGFVATKEGAINAAINFHERKPPDMPAGLKAMLLDLRAGWVRPDGEELVDTFAVAKSARELACGFFYRWRFPKGESRALIELWLALRKAWHKELREKLKRREAHLDSPLLCTKAAIRYTTAYEGDLPQWDSQAWPAWRDIRDKVQPETEAVWVDDYLARDAADFARKHKAVVWYEHTAFGRKVAELSGCKLYGGAEDLLSPITLDGKHSIILSLARYGTGTDGLQRVYCSQLVANPPASAGKWEQLLGRLHRIGQGADEVDAFAYRHTIEMVDALDTALRRAKYVQDTLGSYQKLLVANTTFEIGDLIHAV